ncbi:MAG TPA: thioredoxin domain-containing protein, partial [Terriglobales bacterium]|nr:thioredoxin domain-containing protein [Terriglobales bacterium]
IVNERFVAVKVDRDERPDVDSRYQVAVQAISGQGGWPLTAFLTSEGKPFYGGTYFPPQDHHGRPSFRRVLLAISDASREKNGDVTEQAKLVEGAIANSESFAGKTGEFSPKVIEEIVEAALRMFDEQHGGFGSAPKFPHPSIIDLLIDQYGRVSSRASLDRTDEGVRPHTGIGEPYSAERLKQVFTTTLEKMARGGVYDQLAGGFHRYSVDERWIVPHFEKMSYDNSELLKNYVHAYQATGDEFFASVARDVIRWMDDVLSDRAHGGFYASQDADISLDDDGDYFTWTVDEAKAVLTDEEAQAACLHYDINEIGEMHHNPAKNVLYQRAPAEEIAARLQLRSDRVEQLLQSAKRKMLDARLKRPTPYIDRTIYVSWNALCVSAYLQAGSALGLTGAHRFALRSLDRILSEAWKPEVGLKHVVAYSDSDAKHRDTAGFLDDYAFTAIACLDAYESTADLSYFRAAKQITDQMIERFYDESVGGFFDAQRTAKEVGVLATPRKPFQDSPTPAGNPMAAIALIRIHGYTEETQYRGKAERTLQLLAGVASQYGIFAATYGIAAVYFSVPHSQVVVVGDDDLAVELYRGAAAFSNFTKSALRLTFNQAVPENLPPSLAATIPNLPSVKEGRTCAVLCSENSCKPPVHDVGELADLLRAQKTAA